MTTFPKPSAATRVKATAADAVAQENQERKPTGYEHLAPLFDELVDPAHPDEHRKQVREQLVCGYMGVAEHIARRFAQRGLALDDLIQVARLGLVHAVDRFDPARGKDFLSFAVPTITGEVRRHFRDHGWGMRVPRRLQELRSSINKATTELSQQNGRAPTASELAEHLGVDVEEVREGYQVGTAYTLSSLETLTGTGDEDPSTAVRELVGDDDDGFAAVDDQSVLAQGMALLPERERTILGMRFFWNLTQSQIAEKMNVSQMHVSRLLAKSLENLRQALSEDTDTCPND